MVATADTAELGTAGLDSRAILPAESGFAELDGVRMAYDVYGAGSRDDPAVRAVGDRLLALLEAAGPVSRTPLPRDHLRSARERPLGPPGARGPVRTSRHCCACACGSRRDRDGRVRSGHPLRLGRGGSPRRRSPPGSGSRRPVHVARAAADATTPRARVLVRRPPRHRRGLGEGQPPLLGARLPRLPGLLLRPLLPGAAFDEADRGLRRLGARDDAGDAGADARRARAAHGGDHRAPRVVAVPARRDPGRRGSPHPP